MKIVFYILLGLSGVFAAIDGLKGIPGLSPDPLGSADGTAALSANASLLALGHGNGTVILMKNNGTNFEVFQHLNNPLFSDYIYISRDQKKVTYTNLNFLHTYSL